MGEVMAGKNSAEAMLARLDERTAAFARSLDDLRQAQAKHAEQVLDALKTHMDHDDKRFGDQDVRLKGLEGWKKYAYGYIFGVTGLGGLILWLWKG